MKRILITGADGFTGRYLQERLALDGHELHGLLHRASGKHHPQLHATHFADLCDQSAIKEIVERIKPERVVHLAAATFAASDDFGALYNTNIVGTQNLLGALANATRAPEAVVVASSAAVYGNQRGGSIDETMAPDPANAYGVSKAAAEMVSRTFADRLPIITVRPFNYTGRGQPEKFIIPKIIAHARSRSAVIELGNINVARDFADVRAVVDIYSRLLDHSGAVGGVFNVCSGKAHALSEVLAIVEGISGHHMSVKVNPAFVRANDIRCLQGDRSRLEAVIGQLAIPSLEDTLVWMLEE